MSESFVRRWGRRVLESLERLTGSVRRKAVLARMQPADIVLASPRLRRLSLTALLYRVFLRSRYVHSMLYLGDGRMIHTTARHGVVIGRVPRRLFDRRSYAIYRAPGLSHEHRQQIVAQARRRLGDRLDHVALMSNIPSRGLGLRSPLVRMEESRLWCSKLIVDAYRSGAGIELVPPDRAGTVTTEDLSRSDVLKRL